MTLPQHIKGIVVKIYKLCSCLPYTNNVANFAIPSFTYINHFALVD